MGDPKRLSDDIAVMITSRVVDLQHPYVSPACFPSCQQQFEHVFSNGTGARCWTAGWGKDEFSGSFQFIQHKVDVPLVPSSQCNAALKRALNQKKPGVGDRFELTQGEVCAGTENGKDACTGDGGSPLVCQAQSEGGRWWGWWLGELGADRMCQEFTPTCAITSSGSTPSIRIVSLSQFGNHR